MQHSEFKNSAIADQARIVPKLIIVGMTLAIIVANVYYFVQAIH